MLRVTPEYVYRLARAGDLPIVRLGRQLRVDEQLLAEWLAARSHQRPQAT
jgi:excisionase family DNA binding protein